MNAAIILTLISQLYEENLRLQQEITALKTSQGEAKEAKAKK